MLFALFVLCLIPLSQCSIWSDLDGFIHKFDSAISSLWHDLETGVKEVANVISNLPNDLYQINDHLCNDVIHCQGACDAFSSIAEQLEIAGINTLTDGAFSVLVDGVDVGKDFESLKNCQKLSGDQKKQCSDNAIQQIMTDVSSAVSGIFGSQSQIVSDIAKYLDIAVDASKVAVDIIDNKGAFEKLYQDFKDGDISYQDSVTVLSDLADILNLMATTVSDLSPEFNGKLNNVVSALKKGALYVDDTKSIFVNGYDITQEIKQLTQEWKDHQYLQLSQTIGQIISHLIASMDNIPALKSVTSALLEAEDIWTSVISIENDLARDYEMLHTLANDISSYMSPSQAERTLKDFSSFLSTLSQQLQQLSSIHSSSPIIQKIDRVISRIEVALQETQKGSQLLIDGVDIINQLIQLQSDWKNQDWSSVGRDIGTILDDINAIIPKQFSAVVNWLDSMGKKILDSDPEIGQIAEKIEISFQKIDKIWNGKISGTVSTVESDINKFLSILKSDVIPVVQNVDPSFASKLTQFCNTVGSDIQVFEDAYGDINKILLAGVDVTQDLKSFVSDWHNGQYASAGSDIGQAISAILNA